MDQDGFVRSPAFDDTESLAYVLNALQKADLLPTGELRVILSTDGHNGRTLRNLCNIVHSKERLLQKALGWTEMLVPSTLVETFNVLPLDSIEDFLEAIKGLHTGSLLFTPHTVGFGFFNATLDLQELHAYLSLTLALDALARKLQYTSSIQKETENEKYAFRCFLLRLGFIGDAFKGDRKLLLSGLEGNAAFKDPASRR